MFDIDGVRSLKTIHDKKSPDTSNVGRKVSPVTYDLNKNSSTSSSSSSSSSRSLSLVSLNTPSLGTNSDEDSTSLSKKVRSHPQVTADDAPMEDVLASSEEVCGSTQGATRGG